MIDCSRRSATAVMRPRLPWLPLATLILLVAALLRFTQLYTLPPGPHYDEAANILMTRSIAYDGANLFPIANSYQGRESLYYYMSAPLFRLLDNGNPADDVFVLRVSSAFMNLITLAASMALGRAMFGGRRGVLVGLVVGALFCFNFHQMFMSRQAYRAVTLPMMQALGLLFLWRGINAKNWRGWLWLVIGGLFCGGAIYTYMASRLFPVWLLLAGLALIVIDRRNWRRRLLQGAVFWGALGLTALPMLIYAVQNPDIFLQRLDEVTTGEVTVSLAESIRRHVEMFFIRGDFGNLRYNAPGRPYFTLLEGLLLVVGYLVVLWRLTRSNIPSTEHVAYLLLLLAPLMVVPSVISVSGFPPSHMRSLGMVPLIFVLVAIGAEAVISRLRAPQTLLIGGVVAALLLGSLLVYMDYFAWAKRADLFYQADGDLAEAVKWLPGQLAQTDENTHVYIAAFHREHPTVIAGWDGAVTWLGTDSLFLPPPEQDGLILFSDSAPPPEDWATLLAPYLIDDVPYGPDDAPAFNAYRVNGEDFRAQFTPTTTQNPYLTLIDSYADPIPAGGSGEITTVWRVDQSPPYYRLRPVLDVRHQAEITLATTDAFLLGTDSWRPGEIMLQRLTVAIPHGTPPGDYTLQLTWLDRDTETYVGYLTEDGSFGGITSEIGRVTVSPAEFTPAPDALPIQVRQEINLDTGIRLLGYTPPAQNRTFRPGESFLTTLYWQNDDDAAQDFSATFMLDDDTLGTVTYPASAWRTGELYTDYQRWLIPRDYANGQHQLTVAMADHIIELGTLHVEGLPRLFDPPQVASTVNLTLGQSLVLYGYSIDTTNLLQLDLVWSAVESTEYDYTVFVHLVDAAGDIIAQQDRTPTHNNTPYPTSLWSTGEYIPESYSFAGLPAGNYSLRIGMYLQATGQRLMFEDTESNNFEIPVVINES